MNCLKLEPPEITGSDQASKKLRGSWVPILFLKICLYNQIRLNVLSNNRVRDFGIVCIVNRIVYKAEYDLITE